MNSFLVLVLLREYDIKHVKGTTSQCEELPGAVCHLPSDCLGFSPNVQLSQPKKRRASSLALGTPTPPGKFSLSKVPTAPGPCPTGERALPQDQVMRPIEQHTKSIGFWPCVLRCMYQAAYFAKHTLELGKRLQTLVQKSQPFSMKARQWQLVHDNQAASSLPQLRLESSEDKLFFAERNKRSSELHCGSFEVIGHNPCDNHQLNTHPCKDSLSSSFVLQRSAARDTCP